MRALVHVRGPLKTMWTSAKSKPASSICLICAAITSVSLESYGPAIGRGASSGTLVSPLPHPLIGRYHMK